MRTAIRQANRIQWLPETRQGRAGKYLPAAGILFLALTGCSATNSAAPDASLTPPGPAAAAAPTASPEPPPPPPVPAAPPAGTVLRVRLDHALDTEHSRPGDRFTATLSEPVVVDGEEILPRGTRFVGRVTQAAPSGRLKGRAVLGLRLEAFEHRGQTVPVSTAAYIRTSDRHRKRNLTFIGGGSGAGALIGGLAAGGTGALIGAGAGAAAGTATAAVTGRKHVRLPAETLLRFKITGTKAR